MTPPAKGWKIFVSDDVTVCLLPVYQRTVNYEVNLLDHLEYTYRVTRSSEIFTKLMCSGKAVGLTSSTREPSRTCRLFSWI